VFPLSFVMDGGSTLSMSPDIHHGYEELEHADHTLSAGEKMACVKMRKVLE
jgi:hypothetical protein